MSTSDKSLLQRILFRYLSASAFCGIFSLVYEHFSHGVVSNWMVFLFLFPLIGGALPAAAALFLPGGGAPSRAVRNGWSSAVATFTAGSCLAGVFEIYGTTSALVPVYWWAGGLLALFTLTVLLIETVRRPERAPRPQRNPQVPIDP